MAMTLITNSADTDSTDLTSIVFNSGIDSTYKLYIFKYFDINPATDDVDFLFQVNATDQSGYDNALITSTFFRAYHYESEPGSDNEAVDYKTEHDLAESTSFQPLVMDVGNGADECCAGTLFLFNPSNTTYVKHFYAITQNYNPGNISLNAFVGGYINDTTAIDDIQFKMESGNFDGTIKMYGVG